MLYSLAALGWRDEQEAILQLRNHLVKSHVFSQLTGYGIVNLHRGMTAVGMSKE